MELPFPLDLRRVSDSRFEVRAERESGTRLGATLIAASVAAAGRTVEVERNPASLHVTFLGPVRAERPCALEVRTLHEGRTSSVREVSIWQGDRTLVSGTVRFHVSSAGGQWSRKPQPSPSTPAEGRPDDAAIASLQVLDGFDIRAAVPARSVDRPILHPYWAKARAYPGDDPLLHAVVLAFLTDIGVSGSAVQPQAVMRDRLAALTLDHFLVWHSPVRADRWMHLDASPVVNDDNRGVAHGEACDEEGALLASFTQHVLLGSS